MAQNRRSACVHGTDLTLEVIIEGTGSALVVLASSGHDGGAHARLLGKQRGRAFPNSLPGIGLPHDCVPVRPAPVGNGFPRLLSVRIQNEEVAR